MSAVDRMARDLLKRLEAHAPLLAFVAVSAVLLSLNLIRGAEPFWFDSGDYWQRRLLFDGGPNGRFSLLNYDASLRGYLLPLIFYALSKVAAALRLSPALVLELSQALAFAGLLTLVVPGLARILTGKAAAFWQVLVFSGLVTFFWQGYFYYPLSDFWAILFLLLCLYLLISPAAGWPSFLLAGSLGAGAFLIRSVYGAAVVGLILWSAYYCRRQRLMSWRQVGLGLMLCALGLVAMLVPQALINAAHFGTLSPMPQTQFTYSKGLFAHQLGWGIQIQRYETFVGAATDYPSPGVFFLDPHGTAIMTLAGYPPSTDPLEYSLTAAQYAALLVRHPLDFAAIYGRHLFNGLDVVYNTPYVYDLFDRRLLTRLINYSLWFLVALGVRRALAVRRPPGHWLLLLLILALPSLASIPAAMEARFMLPVDLMAYGTFAFMTLPAAITVSRLQLTELFQEYIPWYLLFVGMCFLLSSNTFSNMSSGAYVLW
jgi:hypothetical protein